MNSLFKQIKQLKELMYKKVWELQDKNLEVSNAVTETQADIVEAMMDEFNALG